MTYLCAALCLSADGIRGRQEWQEKVVNVQRKIDELELDLSQFLDDLDAALALLTYMGKLFERLDEKQKNNLLQIVVKRIIINPQGEIIDCEFHSPFSYLISLTSRSNGKSEEGGGSELIRLGSLITLAETLKTPNFRVFLLSIKLWIISISEQFLAP